MGGWVQAAESSISSLFLPKRNQTVARPKESEKEENQGGDECEERERERVYLHRQSLRSYGYHSGVSTSSTVTGLFRII